MTQNMEQSRGDIKSVLLNVSLSLLLVWLRFNAITATNVELNVLKADSVSLCASHTQS